MRKARGADLAYLAALNNSHADCSGGSTHPPECRSSHAFHSNHQDPGRVALPFTRAERAAGVTDADAEVAVWVPGL